jgi:hypothetical protein
MCIAAFQTRRITGGASPFEGIHIKPLVWRIQAEARSCSTPCGFSSLTDSGIGPKSIFPAETCGEGIAGTKSYNVSDLPKKSANDSRSSFAVESGKKMRESVQHGNLSFFRKSTPFCGGDKSKEAAAKRARQGQLK